MKTWKLVSGIISMVISLVVTFQSCAVGVLEAMGAEGSDSASGIIVAILLIAGGVVSVATRKGGKGGNIAIISIYGIAAISGSPQRYTKTLMCGLFGAASACCWQLFLLRKGQSSLFRRMTRQSDRKRDGEGRLFLYYLSLRYGQRP